MPSNVAPANFTQLHEPERGAGARRRRRIPGFILSHLKIMKTLLSSVALAAGLSFSVAGQAQAPAAAPAGATGLCKDGSYASKDTKKGACAKHGGIKDWYAEAGAAAAPAAAATKAAPAVAGSTPAVAPAPTTAPAKAPAKTAAAAPATAPAPGGGPGQVWVNSSSKVYHCSGTKYYGTTKHGEYMTEAAAKAAGNHADHGKACAT